jgi:hypothetical protein
MFGQIGFCYLIPKSTQGVHSFVYERPVTYLFFLSRSTGRRNGCHVTAMICEMVLATINSHIRNAGRRATGFLSLAGAIIS